MFNRSVIKLNGPCSIPKWNSHRVSFTSPAKNITSLASRFRRYSKARKLCRRTAWRLGFPKKESMDKVESFWSYKWRFEREKHRKTSENPGEIHEQNGGLVRENHRTMGDFQLLCWRGTSLWTFTHLKAQSSGFWSTLHLHWGQQIPFFVMKSWFFSLVNDHFSGEP